MFTKVTKVAACFGSGALILSYQKLQAKDLIDCHDCCKKRLPKAHELPIYDKEENLVCEYDEKSSLPFISEISIARKKIFEYASYVNMVQERAVQMYDTGVAHSKTTFDYLKDEENKVQRALIIASGGLVGLLLARRGGIFRKTVYTSLGTGAAFYAFYPAISKEYALIGWNFSKEHINNALTNYGGIDTQKIAEETNAKVDYIKSAMKFESLTKMLNEQFYKKNKASNELEKSKETNQDMYTTRAA